MDSNSGHLLTVALAYKNTSMFNSSVLVGKGSSNFCNTLGCKMPNVPMRFALPSTPRKMAAAWPAR